MIKNVVTHIGGIENFGILSIGLFFTVFLGMLVWAFCRKRAYLDTMSALPLERDHEMDLHSTSQPESRHE